jgi:hypothetical protein
MQAKKKMLQLTRVTVAVAARIHLCTRLTMMRRKKKAMDILVSIMVTA